MQNDTAAPAATIEQLRPCTDCKQELPSHLFRTRLSRGRPYTLNRCNPCQYLWDKAHPERRQRYLARVKAERAQSRAIDELLGLRPKRTGGAK